MPIISPGGGGGGSSPVFQSVLSAQAVSIDTGANGIPGSGSFLTIAMLIRTDGAGATDTCAATFNNDGAGNAHYDRLVTANANTSVSGAIALAGDNYTLTVHGNGGGASFATAVILRIPGYANATLFKSGDLMESVLDSTAGNTAYRLTGLAYRNTGAITRFAITATGHFLAGSSMFVYVQ